MQHDCNNVCSILNLREILTLLDERGIFRGTYFMAGHCVKWRDCPQSAGRLDTLLEGYSLDRKSTVKMFVSRFTLEKVSSFAIFIE